MTAETFRLRIYQDHLTEGSSGVLPKELRVIYCVAGDAVLSAPGRSQILTTDQAWFSNQETRVRGEVEGACLWRWELVRPSAQAAELAGEGIKCILAGDFPIEIDTSVKRLMRLDRVSFPLGGEALTHVHAAPGVRCLISGNLLIVSIGKKIRIWPGDAWVEHGPHQVYAKASEKDLSSFVRVMIIPEEYRGRSTITYVRPEDKDRPKSQSYKRYLEEAVVF